MAGLGFAGALLGFLGSYECRVDAFAAPGFSPTLTHQVAPANEDQANDLRFQEAAGQVSRTLAAAGLPEPGPGQAPDVFVFVKYTVSEPQTRTVTSTVPVYGFTNAPQAQTTATLPPFG